MVGLRVQNALNIRNRIGRRKQEPGISRLLEAVSPGPCAPGGSPPRYTASIEEEPVDLS